MKKITIVKLANEDSNVLNSVNVKLVKIAGEKVAIVFETKIYKIPIITKIVAFFRFNFTPLADYIYSILE